MSRRPHVARSGGPAEEKGAREAAAVPGGNNRSRKYARLLENAVAAKDARVTKRLISFAPATLWIEEATDVTEVNPQVHACARRCFS